jgi:ATP-binding cassette subfamily C protein
MRAGEDEGRAVRQAKGAAKPAGGTSWNNPYRRALRGLRGTFVAVALISAAINVLMLTGPLYMLQVYDRVLGSGSVATLQGLFLIVVVLYIFLGIYELLRARLLSRAGYRLDMEVGTAAFRQWVRSGIPGSPASGQQPLRDLEVMRGFIGGPISGLFDLPWIPLYLGILFLIHPWFGFLTLAGAAVVIVMAVLNQALSRQSIKEAMAQESTDRFFTEQSRRSAEAVVALGMQDRIINRWRDMHVAALAKGQPNTERSEFFSAFSKAFRLLLQSALLTLAAWLALRQEISAGMIVASSIISGRALAPVDQVLGQWRVIGRARESHARLMEAMEDADAPAAQVALPAPTGALTVTRLTKNAPGPAPQGGERVRILDRVNFSLSPGDGLGVIGNSAAGKSTLARLIVGAWKPDAGEVRLDGATLDQWRPEELGRHIGYLPQSLDLLPGTIAENISRFDGQASQEQVIEAARIAGVHEMILALPEGYATRVGSSTPLSGGQIQRIGLARAMFGAPKLIVLDEPNSNLDAYGDDALAQAIIAMRKKGSVVIVMAHRPSAIAAVNKLMILHKGAIAQFGDKEEVLRGVMRSSGPRVAVAGEG